MFDSFWIAKDPENEDNQSVRTVTPPIGASITLFLVSLVFQAQADIGYQFVTVGNPGNANDTVTASDGSGLFFGGVNYTYDIGTYDVTLYQYTAFLNAVAQTDNYSLYNAQMATDLNVAGISRTGSSGNYSYSVIGDGNRPIAYMTWFDAARFSNWLQNEQPTGLGEVAGSTEQGAYTLNGDTTSGLETRNANSLYWIPTESEWYKAAYYDPNKAGPGVGGFWKYATKSDSAPGNVVGGGTNRANYYNGVYSVTQSSSYDSSQNYLTGVGVFTNSSSAYGTFDQTGELNEWNDGVIGSRRGLHGGAWHDVAASLQSSYRNADNPTTESGAYSFRIASNATANPSVVILASLSKQVYLGNAGADVYHYLGDQTTFIPQDTWLDEGFRAAVYASPDNSQIVIAFRGTDLSVDGKTDLKNIVADLGFDGFIPTPSLISYANAASDLVLTIKETSQYQNANITLTGHSLGGSIAQSSRNCIWSNRRWL